MLAKNPMDRLSGDQNGLRAPSVPGMRARRRAWRATGPTASARPVGTAANAMWRPSGEMANSGAVPVKRESSAGAIENSTSSIWVIGRLTEIDQVPAARSPRRAQWPRPSRDARGTSAGERSRRNGRRTRRTPTGLRHRRARFARPRCRAAASRGSFRRHRSSSVRMDAGVAAGSAVQSGSRSRMLTKRVGHRVAGETPGGPPASRTARTRTPRCRCACRPPARAPARGSCRPASRECGLRPCRRASPTACWVRSPSRADGHRLGQAEVEHLRAHVA